MRKKINPSAIVALKNALTLIYWRKADLKTFLLGSIQKNTEYVIKDVDWSNKKIDIVAHVISRLQNREDLFQEDLISLIVSVCEMTDFTHLLIWDEGKKKEKQAKESVRILRESFIGYSKILMEKSEVENRKIESRDQQEKKTDFILKLQ